MEKDHCLKAIRFTNFDTETVDIFQEKFQEFFQNTEKSPKKQPQAKGATQGNPKKLKFDLSVSSSRFNLQSSSAEEAAAEEPPVAEDDASSSDVSKYYLTFEDSLEFSGSLSS